jgi:hypothetical protein
MPECCSYVTIGTPRGSGRMECWLGFQRGVDGAGELAFEAADRFAAAFPFGLFAFEVSACGCVDAALGVGSE